VRRTIQGGVVGGFFKKKKKFNLRVVGGSVGSSKYIDELVVRIAYSSKQYIVMYLCDEELWVQRVSIFTLYYWYVTVSVIVIVIAIVQYNV
jgi:UDP-N-acetylglucosamine:LPS N-acetylglucosamine transferase